MKVLFVNDFFFPQMIGGVEKHVVSVTQELARRGWDVHILTTGSKQLSLHIYKDVRIWRINPSLPLWLVKFHPLDPRMGEVSRRLLKEQDFDLIVVHSIQHLSYSILDAANERGVPTIVTSHNYGLVCLRETLIRANKQPCTGPWPTGCAECALRKILGPCARVAAPPFSGIYARLLESKRRRLRLVAAHVSPSSAIVRRLRAFGLNPVIRIPNGIELEAFDVTIPTEEISEAFNLNERVILFVGRLVEEKGLTWLLKSLTSVRGKFKLLIVGEGPPKYVAQLVKVAHRLGLSERVVFAGRVPSPLLLQAYKIAAATVVPSLWEDPFPTVALESLAMATPVIGSNVGGIPDIVSPGRTGWLVPPGNIKRLSDAIEEAITDENQCRKMGIYAREMAEREFSFEKMMSRLIKLYQAAARGSPL